MDKTCKAIFSSLLAALLLIPPSCMRMACNHIQRQLGILPQSQYWANLGYARLIINFRGSFGFGKQFLMADTGQWGGRVFQDLIDGKHWAENQGWVDPAHTIIKGASFGGYLALLAISLTPHEFAAAIADFPIVEPSSWVPQGYVTWRFTFGKNCFVKQQSVQKVH